jgi:hypothetical protein
VKHELIWRDPPTLENNIYKLSKRPGRWALLETRRSNNAAACKASELRKRFSGIEVLVIEREIYARSTEGNR